MQKRNTTYKKFNGICEEIHSRLLTTSHIAQCVKQLFLIQQFKKKYQLYFDTLLDTVIDSFLGINEINITFIEGKNDFDNE